MAVNVIKCDIFDCEADAILHQVNCKGVMGSGVAKQIKNRYPVVFDRYKSLCKDHTNSAELLGNIQIVTADFLTKKSVVNLFAQDRYGRDKCYTDYDALRKCLIEVNKYFANKTVAIPYKMSCGNGGGNWEIVYNIICETLTDCNVIICSLQYII